MPSIHVVPDDKHVYDDFQHILSTYTVYNDDFILYNLEGLSAIYFVCNDENVHHARFWLNDSNIHWMYIGCTRKCNRYKYD